jgi:porphobilinogen synthase
MTRLSLRRTRLNRHIRELTRETQVSLKQLIQPLFVVDGLTDRESAPGIDDLYRDTTDSLLKQIEADHASGINKFLLFGVPAEKQTAPFDVSFTATQIETIKRQFGDDIWLAVDVCLCSHTTHGHCGVLNTAGDYVRNDATVEALATAAGQYAQAGADCVAPSDMMDGRVAAIRAELDRLDHESTTLMSYSAKFHSNFYGPFRLAANSKPAPAEQNRLGDRASYQIDPARPRDALASSLRDADEGADILMVKPGLPYLDVLANLSQQISLPWAVYQTSGEQAAIDVLAKQDLLRRDDAQRETWLAFRRAGAAMIISYAARRAARILRDQ